MKYKIRYTGMALLFCGLLGWDLAYEYQKPEPLVAAAATPHPVVRSIKHLVAPAYTPTPATTTTGVGTTTATSSPSSGVATSTQATSSTPVQNSTLNNSKNNPPATSTPPTRSRRGRVPHF